MSDKKQLHEDFIQKFSRLAAAFAAGAGAAKVSNALKGKKKAKQAWDDFMEKQQRLKKDFEKRLRSMPEEEREAIMKSSERMRKIAGI